THLAAFAMNALDRATFFPPAALGRPRFTDSDEHIVSFDQLSKGRVLPVKKTGVGQANEELASCRIRMLRTRHRDDAADVGPVIELSLDFVTWIARAPEVLGRGIFG